ncbi:TPA: hypothetical protein RZL14_002217 [Yersinia enterocolitica]|nr:hypothetical protein [Yersinia enterocolitica]
MENIKRFNFYEVTDYPVLAEIPPKENPAGKYVKYSDLETLLEENKMLKEKINSLL